MVVDVKKRGKQDGERINVNEDWERRYWSREFKVSEETLRQAIRAAGAMSNDVERWLGKKGHKAA